jgi:diacylglycerol kinase family enzyme
MPVATPTSSPIAFTHSSSTAFEATQPGRSFALDIETTSRRGIVCRTMKWAVLIVNPYASGVTEERLAEVQRILRPVVALRTVKTERPHHATELARSARDADAILVFSGDGGFNEVLNGLDRPDQPVGFIPGGGTSVLPRALGYPRDPLEAAEALAEAIARGRTRRISTGRANGRRFAFSAGVGLDAEAVRRIDERGRSAEGKRPGDIAFVSTFARMLWEQRGRFDPALEVVGYGRAALVLVANVNPYTFLKSMAVQVAPEAVFEEGLDFLAPVRLRPSTLPPLLIALATGRPPRDALRGHDLDRIEVRCDHPLPLQADGEDLGDVTEVLFEAERRSVTVLV